MASKAQLANQRRFAAAAKTRAKSKGGKKKSIPAFLKKKLGR